MTLWHGPFVWLAGPDRIAHAVSKTSRPRTACGVPATEVRLAWPERSRCPRCLRALGFEAA